MYSPKKPEHRTKRKHKEDFDETAKSNQFTSKPVKVSFVKDGNEEIKNIKDGEIKPKRGRKKSDLTCHFISTIK